MPHWTFALTNRSGVLAADLEPRGTKLTFRLNDYTKVEGEIDARVSRASLLEPDTVAVRAWRDGTLRFNGQVQEPLRRNLETVRWVAHDPFYNLENRRLQQALETTDDAADIAQSLVTTERGRATLHLANMDDTLTTVSRTVAFPRGKQVSEAIKDLANAADGFYFRVDPLAMGADMGELVLLYPDSGEVRGEGIFWANDDSANITGFEETLGKAQTHVVVPGATVNDVQLLGEATDTAAVTTYGLIDVEIPHTDVEDATLLDDLADDAIKPEPPATYAFTPIPFHEAGEHVPTLFDHFIVGDHIRLVVKRGALNVDETVRVLEVTLAVSDDGRTEQIDRILVETVDEES